MSLFLTNSRKFDKNRFKAYNCPVFPPTETQQEKEPMKINVPAINRIFGDRILVRRLERPEKIGNLLIPASFANEKRKEQTIWYGVIEKFGLDSRYGDAYGLKEGDIVGISDVANSNASFDGEDGHEHFWIMEEFVVLRDEGRVKSFHSNERYDGLGIVPIGPYSLVRPYPEEEKRGSILLPKANENLTGKVLAVSVGEVKDGEIKPLNVSLDSDVLFGKYSGLYAKFQSETFLLIKEEDLIAEFETAREIAHA